MSDSTPPPSAQARAAAGCGASCSSSCRSSRLWRASPSICNGGRYISTDNAYVAAQKVLVTPQISGTVNDIKVAEGQKLKAGDVLFTIDPKPYEIALAEAKAALTRAETDFGALKSQYQGFAPQIELASTPWTSARRRWTASRSFWPARWWRAPTSRKTR